MDLTGRYPIPASPDLVWDALNDPDTLRTCIPGCESVEKIGPTDFLATATLKIGPMKATFTGKIALTELDAPRRCVVRGDGQGGAAGFAKGEAEVLLADDGAGTVLTYAAKAQIGGKLAQIGQRLVDGAARQIADDFFGRFTAALARRKTNAAEQPDNLPPPPESGTMPDPARREGLPPTIWGVGLIAIVVILLFLFGVLA